MILIKFGRQFKADNSLGILGKGVTYANFQAYGQIDEARM